MNKRFNSQPARFSPTRSLWIPAGWLLRTILVIAFLLLVGTANAMQHRLEIPGLQNPDGDLQAIGQVDPQGVIVRLFVHNDHEPAVTRRMPATKKLIADVENLSARIFEELQAGDYRTLRRTLRKPAGSTDLIRLLDLFETAYGQVSSSTIVLTVTNGDATIQTFAAVRFAERVQLFRLSWFGSSLNTITAVNADQPGINCVLVKTSDVDCRNKRLVLAAEAESDR